MFYDQLRDRRVRGHEKLVVGRSYLLCHVPLDNPYTAGVDPSCTERKIVEVRQISHNEIHLKGREALYKNPEGVARMWDSELLNRQDWMFRTEEEPFRDGSEYINWHHCSTYASEDAGPTINYVLDLEALATEGIDVLRSTSVYYIMSEELRHDRDMEDAFLRSMEDDYDRDPYH